MHNEKDALVAIAKIFLDEYLEFFVFLVNQKD